MTKDTNTTSGPAAPLPDTDRDYMRKVVAVAVTMLFDGYKEDVMRVFSTGELSEFVTITTAMRGKQVEDIYRRAWDLLSLPARASHGQAPAQAAPAARHATYGWQLVPIEVTDDMLAAFANCVSPEFGWNRATEAEHQEVRDSFGPAYRAMLAAAPTPPTQAADSVLEDAAPTWCCQHCIDRHDGIYGSWAAPCPYHDDDGKPRIDAARAAQEGK